MKVVTNRWSKAATRGALVGVRSAIPTFEVAKVGIALMRSRDGAAKDGAIRVAAYAGVGAAVGAAFALLRERFPLPEAAVTGVGLGVATWLAARMVVGGAGPSLPSAVMFGVAVEHQTRREPVRRGNFVN